MKVTRFIALLCFAVPGLVTAAQSQDSTISADSALRLDSLRRAFLEQAGTGPEVPHGDAAERQRAFNKCMELTRARLLAPNMAKFGEPKSVDQQGFRVVIHGEVDAMNRGGGYERVRYTCTLQKAGDVYLGSSEVVNPESGLSQ